jgi:uncharacterized OsmC-like protein
MSQNLMVSTVRATTTNVHGRTLCSARDHHWIIDGPSKPNEEVVSMEAFLAGIASCATHLIEDFAEEEGTSIGRVNIEITGARTPEVLNEFDHIDMRIEIEDASQEQAEHLVERFKGRCPLYRTVARTVEVRMEVLGRDVAEVTA